MISNTAERDLGLRTTVFMLLAALATILTAIRPAAAAGEPERLVEKSKITLDELSRAPTAAGARRPSIPWPPAASACRSAARSRRWSSPS
jgi:hypothetical protein